MSTINIKGMELAPNDKQAAIVTSVYNDDAYSLDLTSKILDENQCEEVILENELKPYSIPPKAKSFNNLIGEVNNDLKIIGFLGFKEKKCFWMVQCVKCGKFSIREHKSWLKKIRRKEIEFCRNCNDSCEINTYKTIEKFRQFKNNKKSKLKLKPKLKPKLKTRLKPKFNGIPSKLKIIHDMNKLFKNYKVEEK